MEKTKNLMEGLLEEMNRVRQLRIEYLSLPKNAGAIGAVLLAATIKDAERAISLGDVAEMLVCYERLKDCN